MKIIPPAEKDAVQHMDSTSVVEKGSTAMAVAVVFNNEVYRLVEYLENELLKVTSGKKNMEQEIAFLRKEVEKAVEVRRRLDVLEIDHEATLQAKYEMEKNVDALDTQLEEVRRERIEIGRVKDELMVEQEKKLSDAIEDLVLKGGSWKNSNLRWARRMKNVSYLNKNVCVWRKGKSGC